jgi:hypothetical protein
LVVSKVDRCIMWLIVNGIVNIILIYVDDLLVLSTKDEVDLDLYTLRNRFTWLTVEWEETNFHTLVCSYFGPQRELWWIGNITFNKYWI